MATPPPLAKFTLPPLPTLLKGAASRRRESSLSSSFSLGPEGMLMLTGETDDEDLSGANNSSFLPVSPRLLPNRKTGGSGGPPGAPSITGGPAGGRRRPTRQRSSLSISSSNPNNTGEAGGGRRLAPPASPYRHHRLGATTPAHNGGAPPLVGGSRLRHPPVNGRRDDEDDSDDLIDESSLGLGIRVRSEDDEDEMLTEEGTDIDDDEEDASEEGWEGMVAKMRTWRHDAMLQHLYETAAFWGDKVLAWTGDRNDAFWLAQIHFLTTHYPRALRLLLHPLRPGRPPRNAEPTPFSSLKGKERAGTSTVSTAVGREGGGIKSGPTAAGAMDLDLEAEAAHERRERALASGDGGIQNATAAWAEGIGSGGGGEVRLGLGLGLEDDDNGTGTGNGPAGKRLVDLSLACRYLAAQCQVRMGLWQNALEMLGTSNPFQGTAHSGPTIKSDGGFKLESSMCLLRGQIHLRLSSASQAKESFLEALSLDVRCYDAFQALVGGEMMTVEEEWDTIQGLCYAEQTEECAEFIRMMYTIRLKKYKHLREITVARRRLEAEYALSENADVLFGLAELLYSQYKWNECYAVTSRILSLVPAHAASLSLHLACMHHLPRLRSALFLLAHELADDDPDAATSWYAVGLWYYTGGRWSEARRYFGKASLMDPRFGPAWIAFAHSFALEKEHDQAITAYSTATRLFQGSHLPLLFIGMEHLQLQNVAIAGDHFQAALTICQTDPLLFNELGIVAFTNGDFLGAVAYFEQALQASEDMQGIPTTWAATHLNLGHALRKAKQLDEAEKSYRRTLELHPLSDGAYAGLGILCQLRGDSDAAIEHFHEALSINPQSSQVTQLLNLALDVVVHVGGALRSIPSLPTNMHDDEAFDPFNFDASGSLSCRASGTTAVAGPSSSSKMTKGQRESSFRTGVATARDKRHAGPSADVSGRSSISIPMEEDDNEDDEEIGVDQSEQMEEENSTMDVEGDSMMG